MRKKTMTLAELHAHALKHGAEVSVGGRRFNAGRAEMSVKPKPAHLAPVVTLPPRATAAPPPAPPIASSAAPAPPHEAPPADTVTRAELQQLLLEQEERLGRQMALAVQMLRGEVEEDRPATLKPVYDDEGRLVKVDVDYPRLQ